MTSHDFAQRIISENPDDPNIASKLLEAFQTELADKEFTSRELAVATITAVGDAIAALAAAIGVIYQMVADVQPDDFADRIYQTWLLSLQMALYDQAQEDNGENSEPAVEAD